LVDLVRRAEVGGAIARFEVKVDDSHVRTSWKRQRRTSIWASVSLGIRILGIAVVWGFAALSLSQEKWTMGAALLLAGAFFGLSSKIDERRVIRRARKSPLFGHTVQVSLSEEGYTATTSITEAGIAWESFTRAVAFEDGHLLSMGPDAPIWLSDSELSSGTPEGVRKHLARRVRNYRSS